MSKDLKEVKEGTIHLPAGTALQDKGTESAKALRQEMPVCSHNKGAGTAEARRLEKTKSEGTWGRSQRPSRPL